VRLISSPYAGMKKVVMSDATEKIVTSPLSKREETFLEDTSFPKAEILDFCGNKDGDPPSVYINVQKEVFLKLHEHNWDTPPQY
jgi:hypothetical protein